MKNTLISLHKLLRNKDEVLARTLGDGLDSREMTSLFVLCLGLFMGYGILIGARFDALQATVSAVKLPVLFLLTAAICFPTLYMFLSYLGIRQGFKQLLGLMLLSLTYIALVLAAFAPVTFFFLITTDGYEFYKFLNIIIFSLGGFIGIRLFYFQMNIIINQTWRRKTSFSGIGGEVTVEINGDNTGKAKIFLTLWAILFSIIGAQLSYTLSPFFGDPSQNFILIREGKGNFFMDVFETIGKLAGG